MVQARRSPESSGGTRRSRLTCAFARSCRIGHRQGCYGGGLGVGREGPLGGDGLREGRERFRKAPEVLRSRVRAALALGLALAAPARGLVDGAGGQARGGGVGDLLVLVPLGDVQVLAAVAAGVPADQAGLGELAKLGLGVERRVLGPQRPQGAVEDGRVVAVASLVVGLGEQANERALGGQGDRGEVLRDGVLGLNGADARHGLPPRLRGGGVRSRCAAQWRRRTLEHVGPSSVRSWAATLHRGRSSWMGGFGTFRALGVDSTGGLRPLGVSAAAGRDAVWLDMRFTVHHYGTLAAVMQVASGLDAR